MIEAVIEWSLRNRILVLLVCGVLCIFGCRALIDTPVDAIPDLSEVQVIVKTSYSGQAPKIVEDQITYPLSSALMSVPGAETVRGFSFFGDSYVYVIFKENTDIYWARSRVLEYLNQVKDQLPDGVEPKLGPDASGVGWIYIYALQDTTGQQSLSQLRSLQDWFLKYELQSVSGVAEIAAVGGMVKQYQVTVDPQKLQFYGIPLSLIKTAIQASNRETGVSVLEMAEAEYMLQATGYIQSVEALGQVPLGLKHSDVPIFLKDVAQIDIVPKMRRGVAELNGDGETVGGIVVMRSGENAQQVISAVKQKIESLKDSLPAGVEIVPVYDRSKIIVSAIEHLSKKLVQEFIFVGLILLLFLLNVRSVLVALITLPVGILASFLVMKWQGVNANIMSIGGIAIALGAMVDGAIVMIENLHRKLAENKESEHWQTVLASAKEVGPTLFFSLLIITVSFLPVLALTGEEGRLFGPLALTKTYAMAFAAILSVTLMPVLLFYLVRSPSVGFVNSSPVNTPLKKYQEVLQRFYTRSLIFCMTRATVFLIIVFLVVGLSLYPLSKLTSEFMPPLDEGDLMYMPTTYPGISVGKARELLQQTDKIIKTVPEVETVFGKVGRAESATDPAPLTMIETFIQLKPKRDWRPGMTIQKLIDELNNKVQFPGLSNAWVMPIKTRIDMLSTGMKTPLGIKITGPDVKVLQGLGEQIETLLSGLPQTQSVYAERSAGGRYITLDVDRVAAARFGLKINDVHEWLQMSVAGATLSKTVEGLERYTISSRFPDSYRDSPEKLLNLPIVTQEGVQIRLADVAQIKISTGPPMIKSEDARPNNWVFLDIGNYAISDYVQDAESLIKSKISWPAGYSMKWAGQYQAIERAKKSLSFIVPITMLLIAILLYMNFKRFTDVFVLLLGLPFALVGGLILIYILNFKVSVAVVIGFIALAGLSVETGAIMLQVLRRRLKNEALTDKRISDCVASWAGQRFRPVLMTALTTICGLLPVMFGSEPGSEVMSRIAAPVIGGMITSVLLTLFVVPVVFYLTIARKEAP